VIELLDALCGRRVDVEWRTLLEVADPTLCTPLLQNSPGAPAWFQDEVAARIAKIRDRRVQLIETYREASAALDESGIEYVLLKGFTHELDAGVAAELRAQGDIDFLCRPVDLERAQRALVQRGFVSHPGSELSDNHLRPLLKPHSWQWQGDYFDPTQPVPIELHHTVWSAGRDRIPTPGVDAFWDRREWISAAGLRVPAFCDVDRLGIAALHVLRHILRNSVRPGQVWELGEMLERRDETFWRRWEQLHPAPLRRLEAIAFGFASTWFKVELPEIPVKEWDALPSVVHAWFEKFAFSPIENLTRPNKDVVRLHLALLPNFADRWAVAQRRLIPLHIPGSGEGTVGYLRHIARRISYHALALARTVWRGRRTSTARSKASQSSD
jgi:hypothetical protein